MIRYNPKIEEGLTLEQVSKRIKNRYVNYDTNIKTKSIGQIILYNSFTLFNILNLCLGLLIFFVHSYKNLLFLGVVVCNTLISIVQEIRSKIIIDDNILEIGEVSTQVKHLAKSIPGSSYAIDRRKTE